MVELLVKRNLECADFLIMVTIRINVTPTHDRRNVKLGRLLDHHIRYRTLWVKNVNESFHTLQTMYVRAEIFGRNRRYYVKIG